MSYRLWTNEERTILVRIWAAGVIEVSVRASPDHVWGPPIRLREEELVET